MNRGTPKRKAKEMASEDANMEDLLAKRSDNKLTPTKDPNSGPSSCRLHQKMPVKTLSLKTSMMKSFGDSNWRALVTRK